MNKLTRAHRPLRFCIVCQQPVLEAWQASCINTLLDSEYAEAVTIIQCQNDKSKWKKNKKSSLWGMYFSKYVMKFSQCLQPVNLTQTLSHLPVMDCQLLSIDKDTKAFSQPDIEQIGALDLDFLLWFYSGIIKGDILTLPRYGVWSFHHGNPSKYRGRPACFWEIYQGDKITGAVLQQLSTCLDTSPILYQAYFGTECNSYLDNLDKVYFASADWPEKVCARISAGGELSTSVKSLQAKLAPLYKQPSNRQMVYFFIKLLANRISAYFDELLLTDDWHVGLVDAPIQQFLDPQFKPNIQWLPRGKHGTYIADPFAIKQEGTITLMVEEFDLRRHKGSIVAYKSINGGPFHDPQTAFGLPYHLSYPQLVKYEQQVFCLPECHQSGELTLYRAIDFPTKWEVFSTILADFAAVDATIMRYDDKWWLFCTNADRLKRSMLYIWYSSDLKGPWQPHLLNPIKIDIRCSRPAGTPFEFEGKHYRPTQDCTNTYGGAIRINQISHLNPEEFKEETVITLSPDRFGDYPKGLHHLSAIGDKTFIDGKRFIFSFADLHRKLFGVKKPCNTVMPPPVLNNDNVDVDKA